MSFAPQQDWAVYQQLTKSVDCAHARSLTTEQKFALYEDLYQLAGSRAEDPVATAKLDKQRWQKKLVLRQELNRIFQAVDERFRG